MAEFIAGIGVALFLVATAGFSYYLGSSNKMGGTKEFGLKQIELSEDEIRKQELIKRHERDFQEIMNYSASQAIQRAGE